MGGSYFPVVPKPPFWHLDASGWEPSTASIADFRGSYEKEGYREMARTFRAIMRSETLCHVSEKFRDQCPPNADAIVIGNAEI